MKSIRSSLLIALITLIICACSNETKKYVTSFDGVSINFDDKGSGDPTIILVHGWSNTRAIWDEQVSHFSEKYRVIAVDLPGFGTSGNNRTDWSMSSYGNDISAIINELELGEVIVVGFSLGAPVAIESALKEADHVIGVVIVDNLHDVERKVPPQMWPYIDSMMMDLVTNPSKEKIVGGGFIMNNVDSAYLKIEEILADASHIGWSESLEGLNKWMNEDCTNSISNLSVPIIAINSALQPTNVESFRKYAPTFTAKIVNDVGHLIMWDDANEFNLLLEESIQEILEKK